MIPSSNIILSVGKSFLTKNSLSCPLFSPFVRWRKRRWAPKAASKEFYVRQKPERDMEEYVELTDRIRLYRTYLKSVRNFLKEELQAKEAISTSEELVSRETQLYDELMEKNTIWNEKTRIIREARELKAIEEEEEEILRCQAAIELKKEERRKAADERVQFEQGASQNFITEADLQQEIEKALNKQINYNFCIDLTGNRYLEKGDLSAELATNHEDAKPQVFSHISETGKEQDQLLNS